MIRSKGEQLICDILKKEGLSFEEEKTFPKCNGYKGAKLKFDFYVQHPVFGPTLIEFHGKHHYEYTPHFHKGRQGFSYRRQMDTKKCGYALAKRIPMYVIPYTEYENLKNTSDIFKEEFKVKVRQHAIINNPLK